ncbi:MAG TPA: PEGA domain-containing protein [Polyangiaceae bacterium]
MRRQMASWLLVGLALGWASPARADDADALIDQGLQLREQGKDADALALFERAYAEAPTPRAKAQIALAEQALGRWAAAEKDLGAALASDADPWIAKYKDALQGALTTARTHLGDLILNGGVAGADVKVDGEKEATLPASGPLRLVVGTHTLEVRADGYYPWSQPVTIRADAPAAVSIEMHVRVEAPAMRAVVAPPLLRAPERVPVSSARRTIGIALALSAAAPLALGFVGIGIRASEVSAYNADATCPGLASATQPAGCQSHIDAASTWQIVSIVGFAFAGALAATGIVVALTAPHGWRASVAVSPSSVVLTARW